MRKLIGAMAAIALIAVLYLFTVSQADGNWAEAAWFLAVALAITSALYGLFELAVWGFTGGRK